MPHRVQLFKQSVLVSICLFVNLSWSGNDFLDEMLAPELPSVISASRLNQTVLNSPSSVTIIDKYQIQASGYSSILDLFRLVPGVLVAKTDVNSTAVNYHGASFAFSNRIQVLIDGRSLYTPALSLVDWDTLGIDIDDIERIEVVRGPTAQSYGSNSFNASINITTKQGNEGSRINLHLAKNNTRQFKLKHTKVIDSHHLSIALYKHRTEGLKRLDDSIDLDTLRLSLHSHLNDDSVLKQSAYYVDGYTSALNLSQVEQKNRSVNEWVYHINWSKPIADDRELITQFYFHDKTEDDMRQTIPFTQLYGFSSLFGYDPNSFIKDISGSTDERVTIGFRSHDFSRAELDIQYSHLLEENFQYVIGGGIRGDRLASPAYFPLKGTIEEELYHILFNSQWGINKYLVNNFGFIYEYNKGFGGNFSPRISFNFPVKQDQSLRLSYSRAYRFPSILEQNFESKSILSNGFVLDKRYISDINVKKEKISNIEIAYMFSAINSPYNWEFKVFQEDMQDLITYVPDLAESRHPEMILSMLKVISPQAQHDYLYVSKTRNSMEYKINGIEGSFEYRPNLNTFIRFSGYVSHSKLSRPVTLNPLLVDETNLAMPKKNLSIFASKQWGDWQVSAKLFYTAGMEWFGHGSELDSYIKKDLNISKTWNLNQQVLKVNAGVENIGAGFYEFNRNVRIEPSYYLSLKYYLGK